jgi:solute carrier family 25 (mitochondrial carnitine/acylcarnitine transporter), member 20/29
MSADFYAGYISGVVGICMGNPLDVVKVQLQAGHRASVISSDVFKVRNVTALLKGMLLLINLLTFLV